MPEKIDAIIRKCSLLIAVIPMCQYLLSQENLSEIRKLIETIAEEQALSGEVIDIEVLAADLEYLYKNPLNLNLATHSDLTRLWVLNDFQIRSLIDYRNKMGAIQSMYEIQYIFGFNEKTVELIRPFVVIDLVEVRDSLKLKSLIEYNRFEYLIRSGWRSYDAESYDGKTFNLYTRLTGNFDQKFNIGILADHDAGELFLGEQAKYGFDFYSGYLQYTGKNLIQQITLGDYRVKSGQGLLLMNGYTVGKTGEISSAKVRSQVATGNNSKDEYNFMRGASIGLKSGNFTLTLFGSIQNRDANCDTLDNSLVITSLYTTGYHRTNSELENKHALTEKSAGAEIHYKGERLGMGMNFLQSAYNLPFVKPDEVYKQYLFSGNHYQGASFDYSLLLQKIQFYGEWAYGNNSPAIFNGICLMPVSQFLINISHRYYAPGYYSPYANGFSENGNTRNEQGIYTGLKWSSLPGLVITAYADFYSYPWYSYSTDGVLRGKEYMTGIEWMILPDLEFSLRYRVNVKDENSEYPGQPTNTIEAFSKQNFRIQLKYQLSEKTTLVTRFENCQSGFEFAGKPAYLLFQDIQYHPLPKYSFVFRYALFNAEDYDSRIYAYEHDVLYAYSVPAYYGKGQKMYLLFRYRINKSVSAWIRCENTNYFEPGINTRIGIRGQLIVKF